MPVPGIKRVWSVTGASPCDCLRCPPRSLHYPVSSPRGDTQVIANHIMPNISFSTGGDPEDYEIIGYVAKDNHNNREIHVFDCGHMAADVIATIGQAFELRYKSFLAKGGGGGGGGGGAPPVIGPAADQYGDAAIYDTAGNDQTYDDLPGAKREQLYGQDAYGSNPDFRPPAFVCLTWAHRRADRRLSLSTAPHGLGIKVLGALILIGACNPLSTRGRDRSVVCWQAVMAGTAALYDSTPGSRPENYRDPIGPPGSMYGEDVNDPTYDTAGAEGMNPGYGGEHGDPYGDAPAAQFDDQGGGQALYDTAG